ncbi:zinc finger protein CONSTANS-LIKE 16-like isoform X2 [Cynara cardunculus var. scolymus]|uniref:zinc finger protein CONSTANS-LIKE 16-like isoform X2 n=1 Tax=Cynara cardunculus var. scolymus TaxID=59895 RepID=UPI000D62A388|nr:zinc finger protein CONSTANS-LIKE 16-like isoform X2 [Cynara cardunculus var. scolymus]
MMVGKKTANAVGGKTARACDSCGRKRARWYCAADDAFLCQSCDGSVHSANQLAGRHERVLLENGSSKLFGSGIGSQEPTWHQGLTRRARTPRSRSKYSLKLEGKNDVRNSSVPLVPEMGMLDQVSSFDDDDEEEEEEEQLLYRVPVFDPFETELCNASNEMERSLNFIVENKQEETCNLDDLQGFDLPTDDLELLEFAADVESLLGKGFDDASCRIDDLGLTNDCKEEDNTNDLGICFEENRIKVEDKEVEAILDCDFDATTETLDWDFGYESMMMIKEEEKKDVEGVAEEDTMMVPSDDQCKEGTTVRKSSIILKLNYEDVIDAWADQGSPWTTGIRPEIGSDGSCWPDFMWRGDSSSYRSFGGSDGGREARVLRYREKRRTRLFSKKIRYEVRKLNAEKRPRMKGRFVKRETFEEPPAASSFPSYLIKN